MTKVLSPDKAVKVLINGGIIIFPTDTAFGIGCVVDNEVSVERLFRIRQRPRNKPVPVLFSSIEMVEKYVEIPDRVWKELLEKYWPGALTVVLKVKKDKVPSLVRGATDTLGVRIPNNEVALKIISNINKPILGPSANFHSRPTPYTFESVDKNLITLTDGIVKGVCAIKRESTVVDCTSDNWQIIRQGAVKLNI
jgi:L-threonylcarbamoyladenylate synthase